MRTKLFRYLKTDRCLKTDFYAVVEDWVQNSIFQDSPILLLEVVLSGRVSLQSLFVYNCLNGWR